MSTKLEQFHALVRRLRRLYWPCRTHQFGVWQPNYGPGNGYLIKVCRKCGYMKQSYE